MSTDAKDTPPSTKGAPWIVTFPCDGDTKSDVLRCEGEVSPGMLELFGRATGDDRSALGQALHSLMCTVLAPDPDPSEKPTASDIEDELKGFATAAQMPLDDVRALCEAEEKQDGEWKWRYVTAKAHDDWLTTNGFPVVHLVRLYPDQ